MTWLTLTTHWDFCHSTGWGLIQTRHITKKVVLATGFNASEIYVQDCSRQLGFSNIFIMHQTILYTNCDQPFESLSHLFKSDNQPNLKKQIKTAVPTFQTLANQSNSFWYLSSYGKFVSYKNHSSWTVGNWRYANDVQYVRSKQVS